MFKNWKFLLFIILGVHLFLLTQLRFTAWPEMTLWPYLMNIGWLPYQDIAIAHTPLLLVKLAIFYKIFGVGILQLKIFTWITILLSDVLVFLIAKKLWNLKVAFVSLVASIFLSIFYDGNGLWFDLFMVPMILGSYYFISQKKYFWSGILFALAVITKQTAVWFLIPIVISLLSSKSSIKDYFKVALGGAVILILFVVALSLFGILPSFWNWAIGFGVFILPKSQGQIQLPEVNTLISAIFPFTIFILLFIKSKFRYISLLLWAIAGGLGALPRFEYFHFQPAVPFLAIAVGLVLTSLEKKDILIKIFISGYIVFSLILFSRYIVRNFGGGTRFLETNVSDIVSYVKNNTNEGDAIFVMNWWDNIYALTGTLPGVKPWVPQLSWYQEVPGIQEKEVESLESSKPKIILMNEYEDTGLASYKPQKIYDYVMLNYELKEEVGGIQILVPNK